LSLYLWELSKSVSGVEVLKRPNASVAIGGNVTDAADDVEIDTVPVTGNGLSTVTTSPFLLATILTSKRVLS
jgi:hypothetical protein